ncbi:MAG: VOC family protein [Pseudohaliea sp.]
MPNKLAHFAIEADDVDRARKFYEQVFGWSFEPWGPPDFYLIKGAGVHGALQKRSQAAAYGRGGIEVSYAVSSLADARTRVERAGGALRGGEVSIPTVGSLTRFADTEGNEAILVQYEPAYARELGLTA